MIENHLGNVDLNLLVYLDLLLDERSVTRAAERAGVTQSAMSRALGRLRDLFGDPLLVRAGAEMSPTVRAEALRPRVRDALQRLVHEVLSPPVFVPSEAHFTLVVGSTDMSDQRLIVPLVKRLAQEAPGVSLHVRNVSHALSSALENGTIDLLVGVLPAAPSTIRTRSLLTEGFRCLVRPGHPALKDDGTLDLEAFVASPHVLVSPQGKPGGFVDTVLADLGRTRRVAVMIQGFATAPALLVGTDYVLTYPDGLVDDAAARFGLVAAEPPFEAPTYRLGLYWHERWQHDAGHAWIRDQISAVATADPSSGA